jgi:signal transduction histidine kinase/response regulator RpfG family c-di-GMP phosphodiesterase
MITDIIKPKVLYVDDEEENLLVFKATFKKLYHVLTAGSAQEGIQLIQENPVDILISDQRMPGITGVEFLNSLPEEPQNIRMILTGYSDMEAIIEALNSGKIYKYIAKPWEKNELHKVMEGAMNELETIRNAKIQAEFLKEEKKVIETAIGSGVTADGDMAIRIELIRQKEELQELHRQVSESNKNMSLLSEIGQEIITNLTIESIIESTYENVNALMDANGFGVGIYNPEEKRIEFSGAMEKGAKLPTFSLSLEESNRPAVKCFLTQDEVIINDAQMPVMEGDETLSLIYLPLIVNDTPIGVITAQSFSLNAYTDYHLNMLRNIAIYVATALKNATTYRLIEDQKKEIEQKNTELEHKVKQRTEQLQQKNEEIQLQRDQIEATFNNVKLLSKIGRQITSTLSIEKIVETVYENVNNLMDATIFSIGVLHKDEGSIEFSGAMEKGEKLPTFHYSMEDENRAAIWCLKNRKEIIINDFQTEYNKYIKNINKPVAGNTPESLVYLPLMSMEGPLGTLSVQSFKKHIYNNYHIDILRTLASYITIAIQNANSYRQMTRAFEDLKTAQTKLVESEKMASLGVLTAGVAHEINNPVNFISAGIETLIGTYADIKELLGLFLRLEPGSADSDLWHQINRMKDEMHAGESLAEADQLLASIKTGARRTAEIVKGLRNFTRLDENDMKKANLEEGIDNTLVILNNQLKNRIEVIREYGNVPHINCFPGQLNQVFMNLIHNAAQAILQKGTIRINTSYDEQEVVIRISDDGPGMTEAVRSHIFEPFFTTKPVGKGTGLGLSIAYGIIEKHKGSIEVQSQEGVGTEFKLTLPLH